MDCKPEGKSIRSFNFQSSKVVPLGGATKTGRAATPLLLPSGRQQQGEETAFRTEVCFGEAVTLGIPPN